MKIDLSSFCPVQKDQYRATCYAYAVAYTAFSTKFNLINKINDTQVIEKNAFSEGFVASMVRSKQKGWMRMINVHCGMYGTADLALDVLMEFGCVTINEFNCDCQIGASRTMLKKAKKNTIKDYMELTTGFEHSNKSIMKIRNELNNNNPVIAAIHQTDEFYELSRGQVQLKDLNNGKENANHVVCILGYDNDLFNGEGAFLIKNNYLNWADKGFCWVKCADFMYLIDTSYVMIF